MVHALGLMQAELSAKEQKSAQPHVESAVLPHVLVYEMMIEATSSCRSWTCGPPGMR